MFCLSIPAMLQLSNHEYRGQMTLKMAIGIWRLSRVTLQNGKEQCRTPIIINIIIIIMLIIIMLLDR